MKPPPYRFAIIGAGWRTDFFLRICAALPERFQLAGVVARRPERRAELGAQWGVATFDSVAALLDAGVPEFLVGSVSYAANFEVNRALLETGLPVFTETPPAATLDQMRELWELMRSACGRLQVAEQFHRQPHHAARLAAVREGRLGPVHQVYVSLCHGYHGTSLIRHFLDVSFQEARIIGMGWSDRLRDPGSRAGMPPAADVKDFPQQIALLDFGGGKQAVFDFSSVQYFSPIRRQRVTVRGEQGEIVDHTLSAYSDEGDPVSMPFERVTAGPNGNLEGHHLKGIQLGGRWIYRNPTAPARLSDEEIAMADLLAAMGEYTRGGPAPYPVRLAMQDHYLGLKIREACDTGAPTTATLEAWAE